MKLMHKSIAVVALLAGLGAGSVWADPGHGSCGGPGMQGYGDPAKMAQHRQEHLAKLKAKLQLTSAQEGAWNAFAAAMTPAAANRPDPKALHEEMSKLTTPERLDKMQSLKAQRDAEQARHADAIKAFYAQLTPEQQKVFDAQAQHGPHGHGPEHGGMMGHPGSRCGAASQPK